MQFLKYALRLGFSAMRLVDRQEKVFVGFDEPVGESGINYQFIIHLGGPGAALFVLLPAAAGTELIAPDFPAHYRA